MNLIRSTYAEILFLVTLVMGGCNQPGLRYPDSEFHAMQSEIHALKTKIKSMEQETMEEQTAIFNYIAFIDSIESLIQKFESQYLIINADRSETKKDRKQELLGKINQLTNQLKYKNNSIKKLETQLADLASNRENSHLHGMINKYRKNWENCITKIENLENKVKEMNTIILQQHEEIKAKTSRIIDQKNLLSEQQQMIYQQETELNKKYILLISRDGFMSIEVKKNELIIPNRISHIELLIPDKSFCQLNKIDSRLTHLIINEEYWKDNRILPIYLRGAFNING